MARQNVTFGPISVVEIGNHHTPRSTTGGMNEFVIAQVNSDMADMFFRAAKKDEVPRKKLGLTHLIADLAEVVSTVGQLDSRNMLKYVPNKPAAIKPGLRAGTAPTIAFSIVA